MKRFLALLALVLGVVSCQTEPEGLDVNVGGEQLVTINVAVPETETRAGGNDSALGVFDNGILEDDNTTMRYILQVYYNGEASKERKVAYSDGKTVTFDVRLVPDRNYQFVVWADVVTKDGAEFADVDNHYNTADLKNITLKGEWNAMDESRDAFTATELIENFNSAKTIDITLKRPFAKLRVVTTDMTALNNLGIEPTKATVTYTEKHYGAFNAFAGKAIGDSKNLDIKHENFAIASYGENIAEGADMTLFTDYFFAEDDATNFVLEVFDQNNQTIKSGEFTTDIYVKRNYLTTIKGNILTDNNNFDVTIEDGFAGESGKEDGKTFANVDTAEELLDAINKGIENITVEDDIDLNDLLTAGTLATRAGEKLPFVIAEDKTLVLDLNGFNITAPFESGSTEKHYYAFENKGTFTVKDSKGGGQIIARGNFNYGTMTLESGSIVACDGNGGYGVRNYENATFVMNGGSISTSLEDDHQVDKGGYDATTLRVDYGANATINGGTINNICDFTLAIENYGTTTIKGGTFTSVHTTIGNSSTMTIDGGSFTCNGLEGITAHALWATTGSTTTINGGTFDGKDNFNGFNVDAAVGAVVNINGGKFLPVHSGSLYGDGSIVVKGGEFFDDPSARVAAGYSVVDNGDGTYKVINLRAPEVEIYGLTLKPDGDNSKIVVNDKEGFLNLTKLFNDWTDLFTDGNGTTYTNYANGAGVNYYYAGRWTVSLEADIDLNNATISPIIIKHPVSTGSPAFEGNNHTIKNAKIATDTATENEAGLFVASPCGFKGLKLDNIHVTGSNVGNSTAGVLTGSNRVGIDNITITNSSVEGGKYTGGVVGYGYTDVTNCTLTNVSVKGGYKLGGLIGYICVSGDNTGEVTGNTLTECSVDGIGNGIYAGGKSEYITGMLVGNYNCNGTCKDNVVYGMTTTANKIIGKIEAGKVVNESNNIVTYVAKNYESLNNAIAAGADTILIKGEIDLTTAILSGYNGTIIGADDTAVINTRNYTPSSNEAYQLRSNDLTFKNITVKLPTGGDWLQSGFVGTGTIVFDECDFVGQATLNGSATWIFNDCTFVSTESGKYASFVYGATKATFNRCSFSGVERAAKVYGTGGTLNVEYNTCEFTSSSLNKSGVEIDASYATTTVALNNCTQTAMAGLFALEGSKGTVLIDGYTWITEGLVKKDNEYVVSSKNGLNYFSNKTADNGSVIKLAADIDFEGAEFKAVAAGYSKSLTFDGQDHIIKNVKIATCSHNSVGSAGLFFCYTGGTLNVSNLVVEKATSEGATYAGIITGYTQGYATLTNITVKECNVSGIKKIGGVAGFIEASTSKFIAENCKVIGTTVTATEKQAGTIIGYNAKPATLKNCTVESSTATAPAYCDGGVRCTDPAQAELTIE